MRPLLAAVATLLALAAPAHATDYERVVRPGITSFKRLITGSEPQNIYAVRVDLTVPNIGLYASADRRGDEWAVDTLDFAEEVDAIAALNGDWSCTSCSGNNYLKPLGLAISDGVMWHSHRPTDDIGTRWGYFACTIDKRCDLTRARMLDDPTMATSPLRTPTVYPLRYHQAIGANGLNLLTDGVRGNGCFDTSQSNPRSAACTDITGTILWLFAIDGRGVGGGTGMSCADVRNLLLDAPFNCWDAVMLDGGGSTTLVVEDTNTSASCNPRGRNNLCVKNHPSDGSLRNVGNHIAITWEDTIDGRCRHANGMWCNNGALETCQGGRFKTSTNCAAAGKGCQEDGTFAFCVDPRCPAGNGLRVGGCLDATRIASCNDGVYAEGDCAGFGLVCGGTPGAAQCMDARCGIPEGGACVGSVWTRCSAGTYVEAVDCASSGLVCDNGAGCVTPNSGGGGSGTGTSGGGTGTGGTSGGGTGTGGTSGGTGTGGNHGGGAGSGGDDTHATGFDGGFGDSGLEGAHAFTDRGISCGCASHAGGTPSVPALLGLIVLAGARRRPDGQTRDRARLAPRTMRA
ncbi:MAG: hypothetical protein RLZZ299_475 [Pseudomonadota bacterium]|jgi:hypothetical protein